MAMSAHVNVPDMKKTVYCHAQNKIVPFKNVFTHRCLHCRYFSGTAQGNGVECTWDDPQSYADVQFAYFSQLEYQRVNGK